jgi:hypothetical protein
MDLSQAFATFQRSVEELHKCIEQQTDETKKFALQNILHDITYKTEQMKPYISEEVTNVICAPPPPPPPLPPINAPKKHIITKAPGAAVDLNAAPKSQGPSLGGDILAEIKAGRKLKHVDVSSQAQTSTGGEIQFTLKKTESNNTAQMGMPQGMMDGILKQRMNLRKVSHENLDIPEEDDGHNSENELTNQLRSININQISEQEEYKRKVREEQLRFDEEQRQKTSMERLQRIEQMHQQDLERKQREQQEREEQAQLERERVALEQKRLLEKQLEEERNRAKNQQQAQPPIYNMQAPVVQRNMQTPPVMRPNMQAPLLMNRPPLQQNHGMQAPPVQPYQARTGMNNTPQFNTLPNMQAPRQYNVPPPVQQRSYVVPQTTNAYAGDLQHLEDSLGDDLDFLDELDE